MSLSVIIDIDHGVTRQIPGAFGSNQTSLTPLFLRRLCFKMSTILLGIDQGTIFVLYSSAFAPVTLRVSEIPCRLGM